MAHIIDFTVEGLAGRNVDYSRSLHRDVNIFFGSNGSGKTSLLKILVSALRDETRELRRVSLREARVRVFSVDHGADITLKLAKEQKSLLPAERGEVRERARLHPRAVVHADASGQRVLFTDDDEEDQWRWVEEPQGFVRRRVALNTRFLGTSRLHLDERARYRQSEGDPEEVLNEWFMRSLTNKWTSYFAYRQLEVQRRTDGRLGHPFSKRF